MAYVKGEQAEKCDFTALVSGVSVLNASI